MAGSVNDLHGITLWDDLNATGVALTYVSHVAYIKGTNTPVPHTFSNVGGFLTFDNFPIVPAGQQIVVDLTVVLANSPVNAPGTQFINTAKWDFGRLIEGVYYEPLPGEWGISPPMTIGAPELVVTKTGPATLGRTLNLGEWGQFALDVRNTGLYEAWNVTVRDRFPDGPTGGMCAMTPQILSAQVFAADGVTPAPGKGPLIAGTDYTLSYTSAPTCELTLTMLTPSAVIGPSQRLILAYRTQLDPDSQHGATLTNVAGALQWFNGAPSNPDRQPYTRALTDGTVGTLDHEDAHTVTVALYGYFFEKTVANLTTGTNPATSASPGDRLRYTLRLQSTDVPLADLTFYDDLGALNATAVFASGTLALVPGTLPPGADASNTNATAGTNGAGVLDVRNLSLPAFSQISFQFDVTLASAVPNGTIVANQADLLSTVKLADSDDPNINGQADPNVVGDEDPTRVQITSAARFDVNKISTDVTGDPNLLLAGETLRYTITVKNIGTDNSVDAQLRDQVPANTTYVAGSTRLNGTLVPDGPGGLAPLSNGISIYAPENPTPGVMRADASATSSNVATIVFDVVVNANVINGTVISNQGFVSAVAAGVIDQPSDDPDTPTADDPTRDVVGTVPLVFAEKSVVIQIDNGTADIVDPGDVLRYTIAIHNNGVLDVTDVMLRDAVPANTTYVADSTTLNGMPLGQPDGGVAPLVAGFPVSSDDLTPPLPGAGAGNLVGRRVRDRAIRFARERWRADRHPDQQSSARDERGAAGSADRRRRQPRDRARADDRRRRPRAAAADHEACRRRRRRPGARRFDARIRGQRRQRRDRAGLVRGDHGRPQHADAGLPHVRRPVGDHERIDGRRRRRGHRDHCRLFGGERQLAAERVDRAAVQGRPRRESRGRHAGHEHGPCQVEPRSDRRARACRSMSAASPGSASSTAPPGTTRISTTRSTSTSARSRAGLSSFIETASSCIPRSRARTASIRSAVSRRTTRRWISTSFVSVRRAPDKARRCSGVRTR